MKRLIMFLCAAGIAMPFAASAQDEGYARQLGQMLEKTEPLSRMVDTNSANLEGFDQWIKDFKTVSAGFEEKYMAEYKQKKSFGLARDAIYQFSLAWTAFKQAEDAKKQYQDFITSGDSGYAHQWRMTGEKKKKSALEAIAKGIGSLQEAKGAAGAGE